MTMRKVAALWVSLVILGAQSVRAEGFLGLGQLTYDGSLEVLGNQANNETDANGAANDHRGNTITRLRLGINLPDLADGISGRIELVRGSGASVVTSTTTASQYGSGRPTTGHSELESIQVQNAYVDLHDFLQLDKVRLGRQYGGRQGDLLVYYGPRNDDALSVTAFDALRIDKQFSKVDLTFVTGKAVDDDTAPGGGASDTDSDDAAAPGDVNASYLILSSDRLIPNHRVPLEVGYYQASAANAAATNDNQTLVVYDFRAGYGLLDDKLNLGLQFAMNDGQDNNAGTPMDYKGSALLFKADYADEDSGLGAKFFYANASGDDQTSADSSDKAFHDGAVLGGGGYTPSDFRYGEILSNSNTLAATSPALPGPGLDTGANGRGLNLIGLGGRFTPRNWADGKVTFSLDYIMAKFNESAAGADDGIGNEIDLALLYRHSDTVSVSLGYARLDTDAGVIPVPGGPTDEVTKAWAKLGLRWGGAREGDVVASAARPAAYSRPAAKPAAAPARKR